MLVITVVSMQLYIYTHTYIQDMGHDIEFPITAHARSLFGRGQIIRRDAYTGLLCVGSDPRADGQAAVW